MRILIAALALLGALAASLAAAQPLRAQTLAAILDEDAALIARASRTTIGPVLARILATGDPAAQRLLEAWADRQLWQRKADGAFFIVPADREPLALTDPATGAPAGTAARAEMEPLRPNAGVRALIAAALVQFQLIDADPARRAAALTAIARNPDPEHLPALRAALAAGEADPRLAAQKTRLERLLTARYDADSTARVAAIAGFGADIGLDLRGVLNPLVATRLVALPASDPIPPGLNVKDTLRPGTDIPAPEAYAALVAAGLAPARLSPADQRAALVANLAGGQVGGVPVADLASQAARDRAYTALEAAGSVPTAATDDEVARALAAHRFLAVYAEPDPAVTDAAEAALLRIGLTLGLMQAADLGLDALSLGAIYFLAAIGLAITFGVMRVINMAHGEFIMMGAYTGYVVQQWIADDTAAILVALPLAFAVGFGAGVAMERLVIRWLYNRPLETLLATFGVSIALQQLAKNIFGTQARPLTAPTWLDGQLAFNDVVAISWIRVAIFVLALVFLALTLLVMTRTRLGLEVRAVTQNPRMAASMGIDPDRISMLTFGLGSGIAGIAGVAIGLYAQVTSEIGQAYIVQSFMTVVVGGVGNIWGTLLGAALIGGLQKGIEWFNPANTLAAQTYMILFIIAFIQFRPRGIIALRGRAAGD
ncbi:MAG: urea ABC transporter permease subunit UrtB [Gemmobacter sp.]